MADSAPDPDASSPVHPEDAEVEADADIDMNIDTNAVEKPPPTDTEVEEEPIAEPREPTKKDVSLRDFLSKMDDYAPIVSPLALFPFPSPILEHLHALHLAQL